MIMLKKKRSVMGALFQKQMMEFANSFVRKNKNGQKKRKGGMAGVAIILVMAFASLGFLFFEMACAVGDAFFALDMGWMMFAMMGLIAVLLGTLGSVFNTYSGLYSAKDNEMLLSMPIKPSRILLVRMVSVYLLGLLYSSFVMVPTIIAAWTIQKPSIAAFIFQILLVFLLGFIILGLTCLFGWVIALISARLKNKSLITVFLAITFLAAYYYVYYKASAILQKILANVGKVEKTFRTAIYPIYQLGLACMGDPKAFVIFALIAIGFFLVILALLSKTFFHITGSSAATGSTKRSAGKKLAVSSVKKALFVREWKHYLSSATYMLNCSLGSLLMIVGAVYVAIKGRGFLEQLLPATGIPTGWIVGFGCCAIGMILSMNYLTAPSVSLEGKSIWIIHTLPAPAREVLRAKQKLHFALTMVPAWLLAGALWYAIRPTILEGILLVVFSTLYIMLNSALGLILNLLHPNLEWSSETMVVKQGMTIFLILFGGWVLMALYGVGFWFACKVLSPSLYIGLWCLVFLIVIIWANHWLDTKGSVIFETL